MITILIYHLILLSQLYIVCRNKTVSVKELVQVFLVGATAIIFANFLFQGIAVRFMGSDTVLYTSGPVIEEILKISFVFFLLFFTKMGKTISIEDGILLGAAAGAGFGFAEDTVRAVSLGLSEMTNYFPAFTFSGIPGLLTNWLPNERGIDSSGFVVGHLMWTALVGAGLGYARKMSPKLRTNLFIPLSLLAWVITDHAIGNYGGRELGPVLRSFYSFYGRGWGIWAVLTLSVIGAVIVDEIILRRHASWDKKLLLPGEKKRSFLGEQILTAVNLSFGLRYFLKASGFMSLRRQLAFAGREGGDVAEFEKKILEQKKFVLVTANLSGGKRQEIPAAIATFWQGPPVTWARLKMPQKLQITVLAGLALSALYTAWLFLFSVYFPPKVYFLILKSPLTAFVGLTGYVGAFFAVLEYYRQKRWRKGSDLDSRSGKYADALLVNSSGVSVVFSMPFFSGGRHPLLVDKFFWQQVARMLEQMREAQKWVGGTVSGALGFIPILGEFKSGAEAWYGYDYLADKPVEGWDRVLAGLGAIPLIGEGIRGVRYGAKALKAVEYVNNVAGPVSFAKTVREDLTHALDELGKSTGPMPTERVHNLSRSRDSMLEDWSRQGGLGRPAPGHYKLKLNREDVEVFTGPEGLKTLGDHAGLEDIGQVSVDHNTKTVFFDKVSPKATAQKVGEINAGDLKSLQKAFPGHTVMQQAPLDGGFGKTAVLTPDGRMSEFWTSGPSVSSR